MIINVELTRINPNPWQTRVGDPDPKYIKALAMDIAANGLLQAPVGRLINADGSNLKQTDGDTDTFIIQLAFGHNRLAAYRYLNNNPDLYPGEFSTIPIDIRNLDDQQMAIMAWSENEKRRDVSPIERARAIERRMTDFGWSQQDVADQLGLARPTVSNILRLLKLPQNIQDALHAGDISARVAESLLPMYALPAYILSQANKDWYTTAPSKIEKSALDGWSSDQVRKEVERLYERWTEKLQGAEFKLDDIFPEGTTVAGFDFDGDNCKVYCGTCRTCDRRLKDTGNICLDQGCFKAKTTLHRRMYLANAAGACGIEVVDPMKGGQVTIFSSWSSEKHIEQIISSKCENLRLIYAEHTEGKKDDARYVKGHPRAMIVCDKRNGSCTCIKGLEISRIEQRVDEIRSEVEEAKSEADEIVRAQTSTLDPKQLEELARQARKDKIEVGKHLGEAKEKLVRLLTDALQHDQPGALYMTIASYVGGFRAGYRNQSQNLSLEDVYKRIALDIATKLLPNNADSVDELYRIINNNLSMLELDPVYPYETLAETFAKEEANEIA